MVDIKKTIRTVHDWPVKGVNFRDITTLLQNPAAFRKTVDCFYDRYQAKKVDVIAGIDSRGLIFGAPLAYRLGISFVPVRKKGKLPYNTIRQAYALEYGEDSVEMHEDAIRPGDRVVIVDDLIATGGTIRAAVQLVEKLGGEVVECAFVIDLPYLKGKEKIKGYSIFALVQFEGE